MPRNKIIYLYFVLLLTAFSCIKAFDPQIKGSDSRKFVVMGRVSTADCLQRVSVSYSSPISKPEPDPLSGCTVKISDKLGNEFNLTELTPGEYAVQIDQLYMHTGAAFMVEVLTPSGERIISDFDEMTACPAVDSVYWIPEAIEGNLPGSFTYGLQFYVDLKGDSNDSRQYLWEAFETWEYHSDYPLEWWYDGTVHHVVPPDYSKMVCWRTEKIPEVFTLNTGNLSENNFQLMPLHYVSDQGTRLLYGYSLLVKQTSLSDAAFIFWDQMRTNVSSDGGLYQQQPIAVRGNLQNTTNQSNEVLGFFGASMVNEKRIFVGPEPIPVYAETFCSPSALRKGLREITPRDYPAYLMGDEVRYFPILLNVECVDCTSSRGVNVKPSFWPN